MTQKEFYKYFIPALIKALKSDPINHEFNVHGPEFFLDLPQSKIREIEIYLDEKAGKDDFLDSVAYYFDAKSHGFDEINGMKIELFKKKLESEILKYNNEQ